MDILKAKLSRKWYNAIKLSMSNVKNNKFELAKNLVLDMAASLQECRDDLRQRFFERNQVINETTPDYFSTLVEMVENAFPEYDNEKTAEILFERVTKGICNKEAAQYVMLQYSGNSNLKHSDVLQHLIKAEQIYARKIKKNIINQIQTKNKTKKKTLKLIRNKVMSNLIEIVQQYRQNKAANNRMT